MRLTRMILVHIIQVRRWLEPLQLAVMPKDTGLSFHSGKIKSIEADQTKLYLNSPRNIPKTKKAGEVKYI